MNIHFIGFGNMAKAIAHSLTHQEQIYHITATSPSLQKGKTAEGIITDSNNRAGIKEAQLVILAVKPVNLGSVLTEIKEELAESCLVISVAAGISLSWLAKRCHPEQPIIRAMPNIAIKVGKGATPLIANAFVNHQQKQVAENLFKSSGIICWVSEEEDLDVFTALSGSGPAYVFLFMEALINAASNLGLSEEVAKTFTLQTLIGAINLALNSNLKLPELRKKVISPAGTTAAAIDILQQRGFNQLILAAMEAAYKRAKEIGDPSNLDCKSQ